MKQKVCTLCICKDALQHQNWSLSNCCVFELAAIDTHIYITCVCKLRTDFFFSYAIFTRNMHVVLQFISRSFFSAAFFVMCVYFFSFSLLHFSPLPRHTCSIRVFYSLAAVECAVRACFVRDVVYCFLSSPKRIRKMIDWKLYNYSRSRSLIFDLCSWCYGCVMPMWVAKKPGKKAPSGFEKNRAKKRRRGRGGRGEFVNDTKTAKSKTNRKE